MIQALGDDTYLEKLAVDSIVGIKPGPSSMTSEGVRERLKVRYNPMEAGSNPLSP